MTSHQIRFAQIEDLPRLIDLCAQHADYEKAAYDPKRKPEMLSQALFSDPAALYCLVVELEGSLIGYATYMKQYSTWGASYYIYMDCLYMEEVARGKGIGEELVRRIKAEARKLGCDLIQWQTPDFNVRAIRFYKRIGAYSKLKERFFLDVN